MNLSYSLVGALGGDPSLRVLGPDNPGRVTVSRSGTAMAYDANSSLVQASADMPRFSGGPRRLLVEGARTNFLRNPRGEGAVTGSVPAALPTHWAGTTFNTAGVTATIIQTGSMDGVEGIILRFSGTCTSNVFPTLNFEAPTTVPAMSGQIWCGSYFARLLTGSLPRGLASSIVAYNSAGGPAGTAAITGYISPGAASSPMTQRSVIGTLPDAAAYVRNHAIFRFVAGDVVEASVFVGWPQLELAAFASSPILPSPGTLAASSRAADVPVWVPPGTFGRQGTVVVKAMLPQLAPFGASQGLWQIDDGTDQNRLQLRNTSAGTAITGVVEAGGTTLATLSAGNMTPGVPFRAAFTWAEGSQALCLGGGAVQAASAALPPGLARMLVGHASTQLNRAAFGEIELVDYRPTRVSDGLLQALANAP